VIVLAVVIPLSISLIFLASEVGTIYNDFTNNESVGSLTTRAQQFLESATLQQLPIDLEQIKDQAL
jgi:hypothetical protein